MSKNMFEGMTCPEFRFSSQPGTGENNFKIKYPQILIQAWIWLFAYLLKLY
jgi:hypothetical protein